MNRPAFSVARSLNRELLLPMLLIGAAFAAVTVWGIYATSQQQLGRKLRERAELIANSVNYAAESISRPGELQRIVSAIGAEEGVSLIVVVGGRPARVLAATRNAWLGKTLSELPAKAVTEDLEKAIQTRRSHSHLHRETSELGFTSPLLLSQPEVANQSRTDGAVIIHLEMRATRAAIWQLTRRFSLAFLAALATVAALGYGLLHHFVLHPIARIGKLVAQRQEGGSESWAGANTDDELGALARTLNDSLRRTDTVLREIQESEARLISSEKRLRDLNGLQGSLLQPNSIEQKLKCVTEAVVATVGADFARIWVINPGDRCETGCIHAQVAEGPHTCRFRDRCLHLIASSGRYTHTDGRDHNRVPLDCYKIGQIAAGKESKLLTNDVTSDPRVHNRTWAKELGLVSFAGYRLGDNHDTPLGVLALFSKQAISEEEDLFLQGIAQATSQVLHASRAEAARRETEDRFRVFFERSPVGLSMTAPDGKLQRANPAFGQFLGYSPEEMASLSFACVTHPDDLGESRECVRGLLAGERDIWSMEKRYLTKDGRTVWARVETTLARDGQGQPLYFLTHILDITARKQADDKTRQLLAEVEASRRALSSLVEDLEAKSETLRASEERYRSLFAANPQPMWVYDLETLAFLEVNDAAILRYGYSREEFLRLTLRDIRPVEDVPRLLEHSAQPTPTVSDSGVWRHRTKSGQILEVHIYSHALDYHGRPARLVQAHDVTERRAAEAVARQALAKIEASRKVLLNVVEDQKRTAAALRDTAANLKRAQEIAKLGSWIYDLSGRISWSDEMYRVYGVSPETFTPDAESLIALIHPDDRAAMQEWMRACAAGEQPGELEFRTILPDGTVRFISGCGELVRDADGRPTRMSGTAQDITERKRAATALRESEARFRGLYESTTIGLFRTTPDGRILMGNPALVRLLGFASFDQLAQVNLEAGGFHPTCERRKFIEQVERDGEVRGLESAWLRQDGQPIYVRESARVVRDAAGKVLYYEGTAEDITERKQAEMALRQQAEELRARNAELTRFNRVAVDRELRMIELKQEINQLCQASGKAERYAQLSVAPPAPGRAVQSTASAERDPKS